MKIKGLRRAIKNIIKHNTAVNSKVAADIANKIPSTEIKVFIPVVKTIEATEQKTISGENFNKYAAIPAKIFIVSSAKATKVLAALIFAITPIKIPTTII